MAVGSSSVLSDQQREVALLIAAAGPGTEENLTFTEIAKRCGTTAKSIREWRKRPEFEEYIRLAGSEDTAEKVEQMLVEQALTKKSERHAKLWIDKYGPKNDLQESRFDTIFGASDEELAHVRLQIYKHMAGEVAA
jgi:hypothetical protein